MKYSAFLTATLASSAVAVKLAPRENPRVARVDIQRRHVDNPITHDRLRRRAAGTVQQSLDNLETLYFANASLGTPAQDFRLHIDTGSSDLWVNAVSSTLCRQGGNRCGESGTYNANRSSTYKYVNGVFNISYVDGSGASGDYATDTFSFGGQTLQSLQFGIGYVSSSPEAILGIGYPINEAAVGRAGLQPYPNLPQKLVNDGKISANAYSLWLNDLDASTGSILFGGVDKDKFHGTLQTLPIIAEQGVYAEFIIALTGMGQNGKNNSIFSNQNVPVLLDSGTSLMYLPTAVTTPLFREFGAQYDANSGAAVVSCNLANQQGSLDFSFSGVKISVPLNELVLVASISRGQPVCILGIAPVDSNSVSVLGDTFLRSAYVVYDLENNEISLAQTNFNATTENIEEIQKGSNGVPNATGVPDAVSTAAVATDGPRVNNPSGVIRSSSAGAMPAITASPWLGGAAVVGAGMLMGVNGF